jgi:hypothetical protein
MSRLLALRTMPLATVRHWIRVTFLLPYFRLAVYGDLFT